MQSNKSLQEVINEQVSRMRQWNETKFIEVISNFESMGLSLKVLWNNFLANLTPDKKIIAEMAITPQPNQGPHSAIS